MVDFKESFRLYTNKAINQPVEHEVAVPASLYDSNPETSRERVEQYRPTESCATVRTERVRNIEY